MKLHKSLAAAAVALTLAGPVAPAFAGTATSNLNISATVAANCLISTAPVAFGSYDPLVTNASAPQDANGTVNVTCTNGATANITLGQGAHASAGSSDATPLRRMSNGSSGFLGYALFSNSGRTTTWGNTSVTGVAHTGTGSLTSLTVYGRVDGGQNAAIGAYTDIVVATVTF